MNNKKPKYINAQIYSLNNLFVNSGDKRLDRNILTVVGFLIKEADSYITKKESDPETKPFITLPVNTVIKLVGKRDNYIKVIKYLLENKIIEWYKLEGSEAKHGASYYSGQGNGKKIGKAEPYARECRLTEMYFKAVKNFNISLINVNITNNGKLIHWKMFDLKEYRTKKQPISHISLKRVEKEEKIEKKEIKKEIMNDLDDEYTKMIMEGLSPEQIVDSSLPENTIEIKSEYESDDIDEIYNMDVTVTNPKSFGKFINVGG